MGVGKLWLVVILAIVFLTSPNFVSSQTSSYKYSETIESNEYSWTVQTLDYGSDTQVTSLEIKQGSVITVEPLQSIQQVTLDTSRPTLDRWQDFFNYRIDGTTPNSTEGYYLYASLIIPVRKMSNGLEENIFMQEPITESEFTYGTHNITDGLFIQNYHSDIPNQNTSSTLINKWEVDSGLLVSHYFSYQYKPNNTYTYETTEYLEFNPPQTSSSISSSQGPNFFETNIWFIIGFSGVIGTGVLVLFLQSKFSIFFKKMSMAPFTDPNQLSNSVKNTITQVFGSSSNSFYTLAISVNADKINQIKAPKDSIAVLKQFKFLMHPVRFAMCRILLEHIRLPTSELRELLDISWSDLSTHTRAMVKNEFIFMERIIIDDKFIQVVSMQPTAEQQFRELSDVLMELIGTL